MNVKHVVTILGLLVLGFVFPSEMGAQEDPDLNVVLMETTFRIEGRDAQGAPVTGTAFVVGRPLVSDTKRAAYVLVTAAHVLEDIFGEYAIVLFRKQLQQQWVAVPARMRIRRGNEVLWIKHPEVDVAVMYFTAPPGLIAAILPVEVLADDDTLTRFEMAPGLDLNCLGYPLGYVGNDAGFPILRSGRIASYPLLPTRSTKTFLLDFQIFPGNSGGPVFFVQQQFRGGVRFGGRAQFLAGLVSQEVQVRQETRLLRESRQVFYPLSLARVVHASLIRDTIMQLPPPETPEAEGLRARSQVELLSNPNQ